MNRANQLWVLETKEKVAVQMNKGLRWPDHDFMELFNMVIEAFSQRLLLGVGVYVNVRTNSMHNGEITMSATNFLQKAKPVNVREAQAQLSKLIRSKTPSMILYHAKPVSFLVPYEDMLDLVETLDELKDKKILGEIERARKEYAEGKAVPAEQLFKKMGL